MKSNENNFIRQIQINCLGIVKAIDSVCRENNIKYSLCGGSVIGAHLYNGFIPWDDDIDIMMTRNEYEKFLIAFKKKHYKQYHILNYRYDNRVTVPSLFTRIEDLNTEIIEEIAGKIRKGHVFVDITVLDNVKSKFWHKISRIYGSFVYTQLYKFNGMMPGTNWKRLLFNLTFISNDQKKILNYFRKYEAFCSRGNEKTEKCAELMSAAYSNYLYDSKLFDKYIEIRFENTKLMIVNEYMDYLYTRYGKREFAKVIPPDQRFNSHIVEFHIMENNNI